MKETKIKPMTMTEAMFYQQENERRELMKMFGDTAKLFGDICQDGVVTLFGQEDGVARISPERFKEMERLFKLYKYKGLI